MDPLDRIADARRADRTRRIVLALLLACLTGLLVAVAASSAAPPPNQPALTVDPMQSGPYAIERNTYEGADLLLDLGEYAKEPGEQTLVPLRGSVTYPVGEPNPSRVVVFLHGNYSACEKEEKVEEGEEESGPPVLPPESKPGEPTEEPCGQAYMARSYAGYDYLSDNLASHGYTVISPQANFAYIYYGNGADGNLARSELLQATLEIATEWNEGAGPRIGPVDPKKSPDEYPSLEGRLDFSHGVGLMGHSRGGDAVTHFIEYNRNNQVGPQYPLAGVLALAPVDSEPQTNPEGADYAVLLPGCDGDVSDLQGAEFFGESMYDPADSGYDKTLWYVNGANHDFYNTVWGTHQDDALDFFPSTTACQQAPGAGSARLSLSDQQKTGIALIDGFMRYYVGGVEGLEPLMTGETTLPGTACPTGPSDEQVPCESVVRTAFVPPADQRLDVLRPTGKSVPSVDDAGGAVAATGFSTLEVCDPTGSQSEECPEATEGGFGPANFGGNPLNTPQMVVGWSEPAELALGTAPAGGSVDVSTDRALTFDTAVDYGLGGNEPGAAQDFVVTLTDSEGGAASTRVGAWTDSLEPTVGAVTVPTGAYIPLSAFEGVNLAKITAVSFGFGGDGVPGSGQIQLADVSFLAPRPVATEEASVPPPVGPQPPLPTVEVAASPVPAAACEDRTVPTIRISDVEDGFAKGKVPALRIHGTRDDAGCAGAGGAAGGGISKTLVSIAVPAPGDHRCRFLRRSGKLTAPRSCAYPLAIAVPGTKSSWGLKVKHRVAFSGAVTVKAWAYDLGGQRSFFARRVLRF